MLLLLYIYYVAPDDCTNTTANTLHHYLNFSDVYLTSHVQLQFLPGQHHLNRNMIMNNIVNFSLHGDAINYTTIHCNTPVTIIFVNSKNINIKHITIKNCTYEYTYHGSSQLTKSQGTLLLLRCSNVVIQSSVFECDHKQCGLVIWNATGDSHLTNIKSGQLLLFHSHTPRNITTEIRNYEQCGCCTNDTAIKIIIYQQIYDAAVRVYLSYITINVVKPISIYCLTCKGQNLIEIKDLQFI